MNQGEMTKQHRLIYDTYLPIAEATLLLGYSGRRLDKWRDAGRGPAYYRLGGHIRYRLADLLLWKETKGRPRYSDLYQRNQNIIQQFRSGWNIKRLAQKYHLHTNMISTILRQNGIYVRIERQRSKELEPRPDKSYKQQARNDLIIERWKAGVQRSVIASEINRGRKVVDRVIAVYRGRLQHKQGRYTEWRICDQTAAHADASGRTVY